MLQELITQITGSIFSLDPSSKLASTLNFFIYDSIKIILLLFIMLAVIGFLRTYVPQKKVKHWLSGKGHLTSHFAASIFGALTPFCSCSSIPFFLSFLEAGVPLGVSFSFLITSPIVNEYLFVLMFGFFGWKIALAYALSGLLIGFFGGILIDKLKLEHWLVKDLIAKRSHMHDEIKHNTIKERIYFGLNEGFSVVKKIWLWVLVGIGIGALINFYVPAQTIQSFIAKGGIFAVPLAVLLGVPIYGSCIAIVPIALALFDKGLPLGTALSFMMAIAALSLPEAIILKRAMKLRLLLTFFAIVTLGIIFTGYVFNILQGILA